MKVNDLNRDRLIELKQNYPCRLADEGQFSEITGRDYDAPSYGDLADADDIVPDDVILREYDGVEFTEEDFSVCDDELDASTDEVIVERGRNYVGLTNKML